MKDADPILSLVYLALGCIMIGAFPALLITFIVGGYRRADRMLTEWAARHGYRIIESQRHKLWKGPFLLSSSNNQVVYRVTVQDAQGNIRRGWVRCGNYRFGPWKKLIDVKWDDA
jgi:hypothetical protein